jgi:capsular exopolysaccharide synthesis family protein
VRTSLYFSVNGAKHKVVQVTSPNMGDGKTTLATNLAVSIAQSGQRVVLVDADFRRPRVHKVFGVSATTGLASVIAGDADLTDAIRPSGIDNLFLLPCGPIPGNPAELLTQPRFQELLEVLRDRFDFVLIDTPPLLLVTDPCVVAPRVDGVILTVRVARHGRPQAERANEILATLGVTLLGVVVNGVGRRGGRSGYGYGFDQYKASYGYGIGYGYADSYYQNDAAPASRTETQPAQQEANAPATKLLI